MTKTASRDGHPCVQTVREPLQAVTTDIGLFKGLFKLLRPHQWAKNLLCFVPLLAAHRWNEWATWMASIEIAVLMSMMASALYILNDLVDVENDKLHPEKRARPLASGHVGRMHALLLSAGLLVVVVSGVSLLSIEVAGSVLGYGVLSAIYTFWIKQIPVVDMVVLSLLYGCRLLAGALATQIHLSDWLLSFSFFLMLSLAAIKRHTELVDCLAGAQKRGYDLADMSFVRSLGMSSAIASTIVLCLYIQSPNVTVLYSYPRHLWVALPAFMCWVSLFWRKAIRGEVHSDPVLHAVKDPASYVFCGIAAFAMMIARPLPT